MPNNLNRYCHSCTFWQWNDNIRMADGKVAFPGHCGLYSARCVNAVAGGDKVPPDYLSIGGTYEEPKDLSIV